ncbi:DNA topoisomerase III [Algicola sagamiensis]|uniref:DNA topoisomerase III n=1 Tax=Algicola sagamiensis TaxID=163869 RepID=UPI00036E19D1|nr:DNA topoisomerase III [Algicola sagamiensis]
MRLFIAEKPSLARAIVAALPKPHQKNDGYIKVANGDCVSWCIGHLLEQAEPDVYDPKYQQWRLEHLPIVPQTWQLQPKSKTKKQLGILKRLIKQATQLVHAGDPDREGQLLVDEVIHYCQVPAHKVSSMQRCLISDLNVSAVKSSLNQLKANRDFIPLSTSALARSRADWLYGINLTRACTIQGRQSGYQGVLSIGRVQTPILGLIVQRDKTIDNFQSKPFFEVFAHLKTQDNVSFIAKWQPSESCQPHMDEEGRVLNKALADHVVKRITNQPGLIKESTRKKKNQAPPLPYNLSSLQIDAAKQFGMSAKQVLDTCQNLYEKHKLITYPRSDCRYLPLAHFNQAKQITQRIFHHCKSLSFAQQEIDLNRKSKAWNDKNVDAHHAIIPTERQMDMVRLSTYEQQVYTLIATQYLMQFYQAWQYEEQSVSVEIQGGLFKSNRKITIDLGWKRLLTSQSIKEEKETEKGLPPLQKGDPVHCQQGELAEKETQAPKPFTDASLLSAMTGIARFVKDPAIKKILRETDGLGTEATRAGIIELLFKRQFLSRQGKQIRATEIGKQLIQSLPEPMTLPDMTAQWESQLNAISQKEANYASFIGPLTNTLQTLIQQINPNAFHELKGKGTRPKQSRHRYRKKTRH